MPDNVPMDDDFPYEDIVNLPHHVSKRRHPMPVRDRAAQFAPFAALTGYEEAIEKTIRRTQDEIIMSGEPLPDMDGSD